MACVQLAASYEPRQFMEQYGDAQSPYSAACSLSRK